MHKEIRIIGYSQPSTENDSSIVQILVHKVENKLLFNLKNVLHHELNYKKGNILTVS